MELHVIAGPDKGTSYPLNDGEKAQIGRAPNTLTRFRDTTVSRVHCEIEVAGGQVYLIDAGSSAGTLVNDRRITRHLLQPGDVIQMGGTKLVLQEEAEEPVEESGEPGASAPGGKHLIQGELSGKTLSHYEVGGIVAQGVTGNIYKARDSRDGREVALKVMDPKLSQNEEEVQRLVRAVKTMLPLKHPNLVSLYGAGRTGEHCWVAMEFVDGENLEQVIKRIGTGGALHWRQALRAATHICRALEFAQEHSIIHRNIAPKNVMVRKADQVTKLGDLLLAKALEGKFAQNITQAGAILGDLAYMSPERTKGTDHVDGRSDLYGLGAMMYALLTGKPPFTGGSWVDMIGRIQTEDPKPLRKIQPAIPATLEQIVLQLLAKQPEDRYQTASELLVDLEQVVVVKKDNEFERG